MEKGPRSFISGFLALFRLLRALVNVLSFSRASSLPTILGVYPEMFPHGAPSLRYDPSIKLGYRGWHARGSVVFLAGARGGLFSMGSKIPRPPLTRNPAFCPICKDAGNGWKRNETMRDCDRHGHGRSTPEAKRRIHYGNMASLLVSDFPATGRRASRPFVSVYTNNPVPTCLAEMTGSA